MNREWWIVEMEMDDGEPFNFRVHASSLVEAFAFASEENPDAIPVEATKEADQWSVAQ